MPVPDFQSFMLPLLVGCADGQEHTLKSFRATLAGVMGIPQDDVEKDMLPSGSQTRYENRIYWAAIYLHRAGCLERVGRGVFKVKIAAQMTNARRDDMAQQLKETWR